MVSTILPVWRGNTSCSSVLLNEISGNEAENEKEEDTTTLNGNRYCCTRCEFSTNTTSSIRLHNQKCHSDFFSKKSPKVKVSRLKLPGRVNTTMRLSVNSKVLTHPKASTSARRQMQCTNCSFETEDRNVLSQHLLIHIEEQKVCIQCGLTFYSKNDWIAHMNNVHSKENPVEGPVKCDICSQEFTRVNSLVYHRRTHTQLQSFKCQYCQKIFCNIIALRNHEGLHKENNSKKQ